MLYNNIKGAVRGMPLLYGFYNRAVYLKNKLLTDPTKGFVLPNNLTQIKIEGYKNTFCGYYDVSPFSRENGNLMLVHANNVEPNSNPSSEYETSVGLFNIETSSFEKIGITSAWNWQQGSRLQWVAENTCAYNVYDPKTGLLQAQLVNVTNNQRKLLPLPIHSSYYNKYILSIGFQNLTSFTEYGYPGTVVRNDSKGMDIFDLTNNTQHQIFGIEELFSFFTAECKVWSKAHINHPQFSPNGESIIFTFRFYIRNKRFDTLFLIDLITNRLSLLVKNQIVSHYSWIDNHFLLFWGEVNRDKGYFRCEVANGELTCLFSEPNDGHPVSIDRNRFVTDTYPDSKSWMQKLYVCDFASHSRTLLATLPHPVTPANSAHRCDFHPSLSFDKKRFQIDTRLGGSRSVVIGVLP